MLQPPATLLQHWLDSHESTPPGVTVYRPAAALADTPARGRRGIIFRPGGEYVSEGIAAGDGTRPTVGRWEMTAPNELRVTHAGNSETLRILEHDAGVLRLERSRSRGDG